MDLSTSKNKSPLSQLGLYLSMIRYANAHNNDFAKEQFQSFNEMLDRLRSHGIENISAKRVLDVGCGKSMWLSLLCHTWGAKVTGIDTEVVTARSGLKKYLEIFRRNGLERMARTLFWDLFYARPYYRKLAEVSGRKLNFKDLDTRKASVTALDFPDQHFDIIVSHEVLEHIPDIPTAAKELSRVLKPEGITHLYVHNYCSVSGGHHIAWKYPDSEPSDKVPAWDHLRDNLYPEIPSWINRLRMNEYLKAFEQYFDILDWVHTEEEGGSLLSPEIKAELSDYTEKELLTKGFVIIARPKKINI